MGDAAAVALAKSLKSITSLTSLDISCVATFGAAGGLRAAGCMRSQTRCPSAPLPSPARRNDVGVAGAVAFAKCLKSKTASLTKLDFSSNYHIGEAGATALAKCLEKNTSLLHLSLS